MIMPAIILAEEVEELRDSPTIHDHYPVNLLNHPLEFENIRHHQQLQPTIVNNTSYQDTVYYGTILKTITRQGKTKIVLPTSLVQNIINWYHHVLRHAGQERLYKSILQHIYSPELPECVSHFIRRCLSCQRYKNPGRGIWHVAPTISTLGLPWGKIAIDTISPWKIDISNYELVTFNGFTIIDTTTGLLKIRCATQRNPTGQEAVDDLDNAWLSRYRKPAQCIFDQGTKFLNADFGGHLINLGIKSVSTSVVNPQANTILEQSHDTIKTAMRIELHENPPITIQNTEQLVDNVFQPASYAVCCTVHKTFGVYPGALVFNRDILLPIPIIADIQQIQTRCQLLTNNAAIAGKNCRLFHDYHVGDQMQTIVTSPGPLDTRVGPLLTMTNVHTSGTVSCLKNPNTVAHINIRRIKPHN